MAVTLSTNYQLVAQKYLGNSYGNVYIRTYAKYSSQDIAGNKTKGIVQQLRVYYDGSYIDCGVWRFTGYGNYYSSSQAVNTDGDIVDRSYSGNYRFNNGETVIATSAGIDVAHNANGTKSITMGCWGSFTSWGWEGSSGSVTVNLPTIDRSGTTLTQNCVALSPTQIELNATATNACDRWEYNLDGNGWIAFSTTAGTSATGTITVSEGSHTVQIQARKVSNGIWTVATAQTIDTKRPTVQFTVSDVGTDFITLDITTDANCEDWAYTIGDDDIWVDFTSEEQRHATVTIDNLTVNTSYSIQVKAKRIINGIFGYSNFVAVKTQGGVVHLTINNSWKSAIAYIVVNGAWKQAISYIVADNNWRIGT